MRENGILFEFRDCVFAIDRLGLHHWNILIFPVNQASGVYPPGLQAGTAVEDDHNVFAEIFCLLLLAFPKPLPAATMRTRTIPQRCRTS